MVSEMGGDISVDSQVNTGTRFLVTLPLTPPRVSPANACTIPPAGNAAADSQFTEKEKR
jgi:hypothetical protein